MRRKNLRTLLEGAIRWSGVLVLNYHRVGDGADLPFDQGLWSADAEAFTEQIRFCKSELDLITPVDLPQVVSQARGRYALVTFDDGYRDNYEVAFNILKTEGVRATFFIATGYVDSPRVPWWDEIAWMVRTSRRSQVELSGWLPAPVSFDEPDREEAVRTLLGVFKAIPTESADCYLEAVAEATGSGRCRAEMGERLWMNWDMLREMKAAGMIVGGHTVTHPVLARAQHERQRNEILGCGARLAEEMGEPMRYFSYPDGRPNSFDSFTEDCLREAGIQYAFSHYGGFRRFSDWNSYDIRRVPVERHLSGERFRSTITLPRFFTRSSPSAPAVKPPILETDKSDPVLAAVRGTLKGFRDSQASLAFEALNLDSFDLVTLRAAIERQAGRGVPDHVWFGFETIDDIVRHYATPEAETGPADRSLV